MEIDFTSHKNSEETRTMYTKSYNIEIIGKGGGGGNETWNYKQSFWVSFTKLSKKLEEPMRGSEFVPDSIDLLHYRFQKKVWQEAGHT